MRRKNSIIIVFFALGLLLLLVLALSRPALPVGPVLPGHRLTEEVRPLQVLYSQTLMFTKGKVLEVRYGIDGISITEKQSRLIERIELGNVDISVNDVVAPHLYDAYVAPHENPSSNYIYLGDVQPYNGSYTMIMRAIAYPTDTRIVNLFAAVPGYVGYLTIDIYPDGYDYAGARDPFTNEAYGHPVASTRSTEFALAYNYDINESYYVDLDEVTVGTTIKHGWGYMIRLGADSDWDTPSDQDRDQDPSQWSYFIFYNKLVAATDVQRLIETKIVDDIGFLKFFDATWFNGTHYISPSGETYSPVGTVTRVPVEQTWLWLIKQLESDNMFHLKYVPPGSIFRIKYNGMVYEWVVDGPVNNAGLVEDYVIDLAGVFGQTTLVNATVELVYDSPMVRVYVPSGFQVRISGDNWSQTHVVPLNSSYVDFAIPGDGVYTVEVLGYREEPRVRVETTDDTVRVTVTDTTGYVLTGAKVYVYDGSNLVATGYTNDLGIYEFNKTLLSNNQARIVVVHLKDGVFYHVDKIVELSTVFSIQSQPTFSIQPQPSQQQPTSTLALVLVLLLLVVPVILLGGKRR